MMRVISGLLVPLFVVVVATGATATYQNYPAPPPSPPAQPAPPSPPMSSGLSAAKAQAKVAATHAGFAAQGSTVSYAREHIGHTLACIEGGKGKNVNAAWDNPCRGMGNGVLADLQRANAAASLIQKAKTADSSAAAAVKGTNLAQIKAAAKQVSGLMQQIAQSK